MTEITRGSISAFSSFVLDKGFADPACRSSTLLSIKKDANSPARKLFMNSVHKSSRRHMRVRISYYGDAKKFSYGSKLSDAPISGVSAFVETDFYQAGGSEKDLREIVWRRFDII
ncbi:Uncharacterized protein HZ326_28623 [Fusarium oxysporum f. sp. albedinis]|nr:Uncharacterized protein HZ326_28623 [Fusarium oxysporum f. sp. albedinis]